ncbi:MAG: hypothetical protein AB8I08_10110 [Sandaracinaceae bacterium]
MDLKAGIDFARTWVELSFELHSASATWSHELSARVDSELQPMFLTESLWTGDAPFAAFANALSPGPSTFVGADQLAKRVLFKAEQWSAPDAGGIVRVFVSDDQTGWTTKPKVVLDVGVVGGSLRVVAMHSPCPRCKTTTVNKHGTHCEYVNRADQACLDGLLFDGGLVFDRGELLGSEKVVDPDQRWAGMMER